MQNAKDSVYTALRDRLAALNPVRTVVLRGSVRAAVVVAENELDTAVDLLEGFVLRWKGSAVDGTEPLPLHTLDCEVRYATRGTAEMAGMDRGRVLAAMDRELSEVLRPAVAAKWDYTLDPARAMGTAVWWSVSVFGAAELKDGTLGRSVTFSVFALQEVGK